jgi:hypothetical protein
MGISPLSLSTPVYYDGSMRQNVCPHLGLRDDPNTALRFPSEGNYCNHARPTAPVDRAYQSGYCLTGRHTACPVYQLRQRRPLPRAIAAPLPHNAPAQRSLWVSFVPLVVVILALLLRSLGGAAALLRSIALPGFGEAALAQPSTGQMNLFGSLLNVPPGDGEPFRLFGTASPTPTDAPLPVTGGTCAAPEGWGTYTVQPTDSLYRLSTLFGVTVDALQAANCLTLGASLRPGSLVYVPTAPDPTAIPHRVPAAQLAPLAPPAQENRTDEDAGQAPAQPAPTDQPPPAPTPPPPNPVEDRPPAGPPDEQPPVQTRPPKVEDEKPARSDRDDEDRKRGDGDNDEDRKPGGNDSIRPPKPGSGKGDGNDDRRPGNDDKDKGNDRKDAGNNDKDDDHDRRGGDNDKDDGNKDKRDGKGNDDDKDKDDDDKKRGRGEGDD